jgi:hypothetical protein
MNFLKHFSRFAPMVFALCAGFSVVPAGRAQPAPQINDSRFLFIFDTSAEMKSRLPAVQAEMNTLLSTSLGGQLHAGDSLGVWTFDQDLRAGQFPLQHWNPEGAATTASDINKFVGRQHYANVTHFGALQPQLNELIQNSTRLTVLIFCDGGDDIKWTPFDIGINQVFQQRLAEQKKARQPFVLVLRTQLGQYAGCTLNFPPGMVSVPQFPPLPQPPPPSPAPPAPVVKPPVGPPLIIIGTKVGTNWPPATEPPMPPLSAPQPATNMIPAAVTNPVVPPPPTIPVPAVQTNIAPAPPATSFAPTNTAPAPPASAFAPTNAAPVTQAKPLPTPPPSPMTSAKAVAPPPESPGPDHRGVLAIGTALLIAAGALIALAVSRSRQNDRGSLISRSMRKD